MNARNLWIAILSGAGMSLLLVNLPFVNLINVIFCVGFWASTIFAVWLYRRLNGSVTLLEGIKIGVLAGWIAWAVGFLLSFAGLAGIQGLMNGARSILPADEELPGLPTLGATLFNLLGVLFEVFFGAIGGLIGGAIFRTDRPAPREG